MNTLTVIFIFLLVAGLLLTVLKLFFGVFLNYQTGVKQLEKTISRLNYLPLSSLLKKLDIKLIKFISDAPTHEIEELARNCENCDHNEDCVKSLKTVKKNDNDSKTINEILSYCPNASGLTEYKKLEQHSKH